MSPIPVIVPMYLSCKRKCQTVDESASITDSSLQSHRSSTTFLKSWIFSTVNSKGRLIAKDYWNLFRVCENLKTIVLCQESIAPSDGGLHSFKNHVEMHPHSYRTMRISFWYFSKGMINSDGLCSTQTQAQYTQTTSTTSMDNEGDWKEQTEKKRWKRGRTLDWDLWDY